MNGIERLTQKELAALVKRTGKCAQCLAHPLAPVGCPHVVVEPEDSDG